MTGPDGVFLSLQDGLTALPPVTHVDEEGGIVVVIVTMSKGESRGERIATLRHARDKMREALAAMEQTINEAEN